MAEDCNGKKCGKGHYVGGGHYVCPHNNLLVLCPTLCEEWCYEKNDKPPSQYMRNSNKKVWWKCRINEEHLWDAKIQNRANGNGCPWCSGKGPSGKLDKSRSLSIKAPHLISSWHPDNPGNPEDYSYGSTKKVKWICEKSHVWEATIAHRSGGTDCPYCSGHKVMFETSLANIRPDLLTEWDLSNIINPEDVTPWSHTEVSWICNKDNSHLWRARVCDRTLGRGCPYCSHQPGYITREDSIITTHPDLIQEWDDSCNPEDYSYGSNEKVRWRCRKKSNHIWEARINHRTRGNGCPFCSHQPGYITREDSIVTTHPHLIEEWDDPHNPQDFSYGSHKKIQWRCKTNPSHSWEAIICDRTKGNGCPRCRHTAGYIIREDSIVTTHPHLIEEWDDPRNPEEYSSGSGERIQWRCKTNPSHSWEAIIGNRTRGNNCPYCCTTGYSKAQIKWLQELEEKEKIIIQHALSPEGEYTIPGVGKVDGYCEETNTVYEFHGDYWHGNPTKYPSDNLHPVTNRKYGDLYNETLQRDEKIRQLGYNLIVKWEGEDPSIKRKVIIKRRIKPKDVQ